MAKRLINKAIELLEEKVAAIGRLKTSHSEKEEMSATFLAALQDLRAGRITQIVVDAMVQDAWEYENFVDYLTETGELPELHDEADERLLVLQQTAEEMKDVLHKETRETVGN